jgi:flagellar protein FlaF
MGFGVSGASAIIFLGLLVGSVTLYSAADAAYEQFDEARDEDQERLLDRTNTAFNVTRATYSTSSNDLTINVTNTGSTTLLVTETTVLVDNTYNSTSTATVDGDATTDLWAPGETLSLTLTLGETEPSRVTVVGAHGVTDARQVTVVL